MTNALNHWQSDPDQSGKLVETNPLKLKLTPTAGFITDWKIYGLRTVQSEDLKFGSGSMVKNVMCFKQVPGAEEGIETQEKCCVTKSAPRLVKPTLCKYLQDLGNTQECPAQKTPQDMRLQEMAECPSDVCVSSDAGPDSGGWAQAEDLFHLDISEFIAETTRVSQKIQLM